MHFNPCFYICLYYSALYTGHWKGWAKKPRWHFPTAGPGRCSEPKGCLSCCASCSITCRRRNRVGRLGNWGTRVRQLPSMGAGGRGGCPSFPCAPLPTHMAQQRGARSVAFGELPNKSLVWQLPFTRGITCRISPWKRAEEIQCKRYCFLDLHEEQVAVNIREER